MTTTFNNAAIVLLLPGMPNNNDMMNDLRSSTISLSIIYELHNTREFRSERNADKK